MPREQVENVSFKTNGICFVLILLILIFIFEITSNFVFKNNSKK